MDVVPLILDNARKHGISDEDMLHAFRNPIDAFRFDDDLVHAMRVRERYLG